ncbi:tryptophan 7-halogenase [Paractinoplanes ferrugineus]|uniref:Halogenase n=1 Tax=Paractinoplanes ferrugineus TaxID=113564 RepID=A0A919JAD4_9ACTN|nr:tryptophan 7-halogenase [Actinoplanes ferrugineus]GIE16242.1 halogenase [Actinoplanes ferrugineus]
MQTDQHDCDVLIIGSGYAGTMLGAILARNGAKVVLVDAGSHPRFAIGESTIPHLLVRQQALATRFDVPEIRELQDVKTVTAAMGSTHGVKLHATFQMAEEGAEPDPRKVIMAATPKNLYQGPHLFRQDSDAYMHYVAIRYGAVSRQNWRVADIDLGADAVTVTGQNGEVFRARYLVDASGFRSPLADKLDLREKPSRFKHHSRSIFTHMIDVKRWDDVCGIDPAKRQPLPWYKGTMHHVFDRGWFWVIPFNNYEQSCNPVVSVGLTLDERTYPKPDGMSAEEEFMHYVNKFPAVARQFEGARAIREWTSTGRIQYSSKQSIGHRWCLMSHAAGFIDPLYSRGLSNTAEVIDALSGRLLAALEDDDFSDERFRYVEELEQGLLSYNDDLVNCSYIAFSNFRLFDAVFRIWGISSNYGSMRLTRAELNYKLGDKNAFTDLEKAPNTGFWWPDDDEMKRMWDIMVETCEKYEVGELDGDDAAERLFRLIEQSPVPPPTFGYKDRDNQVIYPSNIALARFLNWAIRKGSPNVSELASGLLRATIRARRQGKKVG